MKTKLLVLTICLLAGFSMGAQAAIISVKGSASVKKLYANKNNTVTLNWQVTNDGIDSYQSNSADVVNVTAAAPIMLAATITNPQNAEVVNISASQVQQWLDDGYKTIVVRRSFFDPAGGRSVEADILFTLSSSGLRDTRESAEFIIQRLQLNFDNQTNVIAVEKGAKLSAELLINYSGTGLFQGQWQLAEPGSTEGVALYKTLKLEKRNFSNAQLTKIDSPLLPTVNPGKYLLRFCVQADNAASVETTDFNCPVEHLKVVAAYQVLPEKTDAVAVIQVKPQSSRMNAQTVIDWTDVAGAEAYQLQIFQPNAQQQPVFVTGMLLPASPSQTQLSTAVMSHLQVGAVYWWRVNALDLGGIMIGSSEMGKFEFAP